MEFGDPASGVDLIPDHDPVQWDSVDLSSQAPAMDTESLHHEPEHHKMSYQCPICDDSFTSRVEYEYVFSAFVTHEVAADCTRV
jgi:hypothetical protein